MRSIFLNILLSYCLKKNFETDPKKHKRSAHTGVGRAAAALGDELFFWLARTTNAITAFQAELSLEAVAAILLRVLLAQRTPLFLRGCHRRSDETATPALRCDQRWGEADAGQSVEILLRRVRFSDVERGLASRMGDTSPF